LQQDVDGSLPPIRLKAFVDHAGPDLLNGLLVVEEHGEPKRELLDFRISGTG
jgi:hypothetical protein